MGDEDTNYLMGHKIVGSNGNYRPQNPEYYRKRYEEKALPFLRLESPTPSDTEKIITKLEEQHQKEIENIENKHKQENEELKHTITTMDKLFALSFQMLITENPEGRKIIQNKLKDIMIKEGLTTEEQLNQRTKEIQREIEEEKTKRQTKQTEKTEKGETNK